MHFKFIFFFFLMNFIKMKEGDRFIFILKCELTRNRSPLYMTHEYDMIHNFISYLNQLYLLFNNRFYKNLKINEIKLLMNDK